MAMIAESIPTRQPSTREAIQFLREKIDLITDPNLRFEDPSAFGIACGAVARFLTIYPEACFSNRVIYNLGKTRTEFLQKLAAVFDELVQLSDSNP